MPTFLEIWAEKQRSLPTYWDMQARQIKEALEALGIKEGEIITNGYTFRFPYKDLVVELANHGIGLSGTIHKKPSSPLEESVLDDADDILNNQQFSAEERAIFVREFKFRKFFYEGDPATMIAKVIRRAETPVEDSTVGTVYSTR